MNTQKIFHSDKKIKYWIIGYIGSIIFSLLTIVCLFTVYNDNSQINLGFYIVNSDTSIKPSISINGIISIISCGLTVIIFIFTVWWKIKNKITNTHSFFVIHSMSIILQTILIFLCATLTPVPNGNEWKYWLTIPIVEIDGTIEYEYSNICIILISFSAGILFLNVFFLILKWNIFSSSFSVSEKK
jgi:hypothetical protein